jgi:hypothetical protein
MMNCSQVAGASQSSNFQYRNSSGRSKQEVPHVLDPLRTPRLSDGRHVDYFFRVARQVQWSLLGGRLMKQIGIMLLLATASALTLAAQKSVEHVKTYTPDAIHWGAAPNALPSGAQLAVLEGDPTKPGA